MNTDRNVLPVLPAKWNDWTLLEKIGEGSYGVVYKAVREMASESFFSAIKIITVPNEESEIREMMRVLGKDDSVREYYRDLVEGYIREIRAMEKLKGITNIVSVQDYEVVPFPDRIGWTIYIRMELLTAFPEYQVTHAIDEDEVIRLGIDLCTALEYCEKVNVIHRDVKPDNIFVSELDNYKLGDFGIARRMERSVSVYSSRGTFSYMAPEVYKGEPYDHRADIYSLGMVMYRLLNHNREPFVPGDRQMVYYKDREEALKKRMNGEPIEAPMEASLALAEVIKRALAYDQDKRFRDAGEMRRELVRVQLSEAGREIQTRRKIWLVLAGVLLFIGVLGVCVWISRKRVSDDGKTDAAVSGMKENAASEKMTDAESKPGLMLTEAETELLSTEAKKATNDSGNAPTLEKIDISDYVGVISPSERKKRILWVNKKKVTARIVKETGISETDQRVTEIADKLMDQFIFNASEDKSEAGESPEIIYTPSEEYEKLLSSIGIAFLYE